jgi:hypothetical protein
MPRGDKSSYTDKQEREADHIAEPLFFDTGGEGRVIGRRMASASVLDRVSFPTAASVSPPPYRPKPFPAARPTMWPRPWAGGPVRDG